MADDPRMKVNGPATIRVNAQGSDVGSSSSWPYLGMSDARGVRISIQPNYQDVDTDASGPTPADIQAFPDVAIIRFRLVVMSNDYLDFLNSTTVLGFTWNPGEVLPPGVLVGAAGGMKALRIDSPYGLKPWVFPICHLANQPREVNLGTERSGWEITMRAICGIGSQSDPGGYLNNANLLRLYYRPNS